MNNTIIENNSSAVNEKELEAAQNTAEKSVDLGCFELSLKSPVLYNGKEYTKLSFDFDKLTGYDGLAIEEELSQLGKALVVPALSGEYIVRMAARACNEKIGADFFDLLSLKEFNKVRTAGRSFLLLSE